VTNLGDVAISLGPVVVTVTGGWIGLRYGRRGTLDQIAAEDRRIANDRLLLERDHRQSYYHEVLTHLARLEDAMLCSPRFPLPEYREWRVTWRHTTAGVRLFGSARSRDAVRTVAATVTDIHNYLYAIYGMKEGTFLPGTPLPETNPELMKRFRRAAADLEAEMRADVAGNA
jgi:hypothetical protein